MCLKKKTKTTNFISSKFSSSFPRCSSPLVHAKILAMGLVLVGLPYKETTTQTLGVQAQKNCSVKKSSPSVMVQNKLECNTNILFSPPTVIALSSDLDVLLFDVHGSAWWRCHEQPLPRSSYRLDTPAPTSWDPEIRNLNKTKCAIRKEYSYSIIAGL